MEAARDRLLIASLLAALALPSCRKPEAGARPGPSSSSASSPNPAFDAALEACRAANARADDAAGERACGEAVAIASKLAPDDRRRAEAEQGFGMHREAEGRYAEAEASYRRALSAREHVDGAEDDVAVYATSLGVALEQQGRYEEALAQYERARAIFERTRDEKALARVLNNIGNLHCAEKHPQQGSEVLRRALALKERVSGADALDTGVTAMNLAVALDDLGRYDEAEPLYRRAIAIKVARLGEDHPSVAMTRANLGAMKLGQRDYAAAEPLLRSALAAQEKALGPSHPDLRATLGNLARVLRATSRAAEATALESRARAIPEAR